MILKVQRLLPDPTLLGSFLEYAESKPRLEVKLTA